jgi:radical SAM superfamily enzyme YgiQ (UPF0313 family)
MGHKVLLVYPRMPPTYWSFRYAMPFIGKKAAFPPLGLLTVAALLPEDFEVSLVDMNVRRLTDSDLEWADIVFTSSMIVQRDSLDKVIGLSKKHGKKVVAGGPYPTSMNANIPGVDHFVLNEAETTLPRFLEDYLRGEAKPIYLDTTKPDIALTPAPRLDLIRFGDYANMALQYSRGCPYSCEFCDIIEMFGRVPRTKTPDQFVGEMDQLYLSGWRGALFVVDDNFIGSRRDVKQLLRQMAAWQREREYPFPLFTEATVNLAQDEELMDLMRDAGFNMVFLGIETPVEESLVETHKHQNLRFDMLEAVRRIQRKGMEVSGGFVLGFDSDPPDIFERQVRFIRDAGIPTAMVGLLTALPNTQLYKRLQAEGRLTEDSGGNNTFDFKMNFVPRMDTRELLAGYKRLLSELYSPESYFQRCLQLLRNLKTHRTSRRRIKRTELRAFLRSLLVQTFSSYGWSYWKFLIRAFFMKPNLTTETVTMAVKGHHFFKMTRRVLEVENFEEKVEKVARAFRERAAGVRVPDFEQGIADLRDYRDRVFRDIRAEYRRLHKDFRIQAEQSLQRLTASMDEVISRLAENAGPSPAI